MTKSEARRYAMLLRVQTFGETHRGLFPAESVGGQAFQAVEGGGH